jgi:SAM-dependent methyltransferase
MRKCDLWRPTKFVEHNGSWRASRDPQEVSPGSRILADLIARFYERELAIHARGSVLDLGCGKAPLLGMYCGYADTITTMDWAQSHGAEFVDICHDLTEPLPLKDAYFDTVIMSDVLEHLPDPVATLIEARRILKPTGTFMLNVPFLYWLHETPHDYFRYTSYGLKLVAERANFRVKSLEALGGAPEVILDLLGKVLMGRKLIGHIVPAFSQIYETASRWNAFRKYCQRSSDLFPLAYGMILRPL